MYIFHFRALRGNTNRIVSVWIKYHLNKVTLPSEHSAYWAFLKTTGLSSFSCHLQHCLINKANVYFTKKVIYTSEKLHEIAVAIATIYSRMCLSKGYHETICQCIHCGTKNIALSTPRVLMTLHSIESSYATHHSHNYD